MNDNISEYAKIMINEILLSKIKLFLKIIIKAVNYIKNT